MQLLDFFLMEHVVVFLWNNLLTFWEKNKNLFLCWFQHKIWKNWGQKVLKIWMNHTTMASKFRGQASILPRYEYLENTNNADAEMKFRK